MTHISMYGKYNEATYALTQEFQEGARVSISQIISRFLDGRDPKAFQNARHVIGRCRRELWSQCKLPIVNLGNQVYGIPKTKAEYEAAQARYFRHVQVTVEKAFNLYEYGKKQNLIPAGFKLKQLQIPSHTSWTE